MRQRICLLCSETLAPGAIRGFSFIQNVPGWKRIKTASITLYQPFGSRRLLLVSSIKKVVMAELPLLLPSKILCSTGREVNQQDASEAQMNQNSRWLQLLTIHEDNARLLASLRAK